MSDGGILSQGNISSKEFKSGVYLSKIKDINEFYGTYSDHLKILERACNISLSGQGRDIYLCGHKDDVMVASRVLSGLENMVSEGFLLEPDEFQKAIRAAQSQEDFHDMRDMLLTSSILTTKNKKIYPKTPTQKRYIDAIQTDDLIFGIGPAGTGKTYLAVAMALTYLLAKKVSRIILARPAVEAGESLGFLPGDMYQKVNPYLRPLYDALYDMLEVDRANRMVERGVIEVAPIAYMRGRTLNDSFIIMDEAQNTTPEQMKMFLTRLGFNAKAVITGDITQIDLPTNKKSGLVQVQGILKNVPSVQFIYFTKVDVVRCKLVQNIVKAYEQSEQNLHEKNVQIQ
jgi:phosphate starvation-inducible protein PhoH and related proteins